MKLRLFVIVVVLALSVLACNLPGGSEPSPEPPLTAIPTPTMEPAADSALPTSTEAVPLATVSMEGAPPLPIVYGDRTVVPNQVVLLNPLDGTPISRLDAPELGWGGNGGVAENSLFYIDADYETAYRLTFSGVRQELLFLNPDGGYFEGVLLPSPDGLRMAVGSVLSFDASGAHVRLSVINIDGTGEKILIDEILPERPTRPTPIKWSEDGQSLFYMNVIEGVEGFGGTDLLRVDIDSGIREKIFADLNCLCSTSVSPDDSMAVRFMQHGTPVMVLKDLATGEEQFVSFPGKYLQAWDIVWAQDSRALIVTLGLGNWEADAYSVIKVDLDSLEQTFLITDDPRLLRAVVWPIMETIWLNDTDGNLWRMDSSTLNLTLTASEAWIIPSSE